MTYSAGSLWLEAADSSSGQWWSKGQYKDSTLRDEQCYPSCSLSGKDCDKKNCLNICNVLVVELHSAVNFLGNMKYK